MLRSVSGIQMEPTESSGVRLLKVHTKPECRMLLSGNSTLPFTVLGPHLSSRSMDCTISKFPLP